MMTLPQPPLKSVLNLQRQAGTAAAVVAMLLLVKLPPRQLQVATALRSLVRGGIESGQNGQNGPRSISNHTSEWRGGR